MKKIVSILLLILTPFSAYAMNLEEAYKQAKKQLRPLDKEVRKVILEDIQAELIQQPNIDEISDAVLQQCIDRVLEANRITKKDLENSVRDHDKDAKARRRAARAAMERNQQPQPNRPVPAHAPAPQQQEDDEVPTLTNVGSTRRLTGLLATLAPEVVHLVSEQQQDGVTCGYWSLTNAASINQLIEEKKRITSENIKERTLHLKDYMWDILPNPVRQLNDDEITNALEQFGLIKDTYVLGYARSKMQLEKKYGIVPHNVEVENQQGQLEIPAEDYQLVQARTSLEHTMKEVNNDIHKLDTRRVISFICNLGNSHWILISVVKIPGLAPTMLILNSSDNGRGSIDERINDFAMYIYELLLI